jgi:uncharacterized membrane protein HdeD (DUF308 family)
LTRQLGSIESLDGKAATLLGFAGVVLGLVFTSSAATDHWNLGLTVGAFLITLAILVYLVALLPRRYKTNPSPITLARYMNRDPDQTAQAVVESINRAILYNADIQRWKARALRIGAILVVLGLMIMSLSLIYTVETSDTGAKSPSKGKAP